MPTAPRILVPSRPRLHVEASDGPVVRMPAQGLNLTLTSAPGPPVDQLSGSTQWVSWLSPEGQPHIAIDNLSPQPNRAFQWMFPATWHSFSVKLAWALFAPAVSGDTVVLGIGVTSFGHGDPAGSNPAEDNPTGFPIPPPGIVQLTEVLPETAIAHDKLYNFSAGRLVGFAGPPTDNADFPSGFIFGALILRES